MPSTFSLQRLEGHSSQGCPQGTWLPLLWSTRIYRLLCCTVHERGKGWLGGQKIPHRPHHSMRMAVNGGCEMMNINYTPELVEIKMKWRNNATALRR